MGAYAEAFNRDRWRIYKCEERLRAINLGGNEHLVELNEAHHVVQESDDQGAVDMFGNPTFRGNVFRYNFWHHIGSGVACGQGGIRLDDAISGVLMYGKPPSLRELARWIRTKS